MSTNKPTNPLSPELTEYTELQLAMLQEGVQVRTWVDYLEDTNEEIARLRVFIYPLPAGSLLDALTAKIQKAVLEFMVDQKLASGETSDLLNPTGTIQ